jgi:preprotein translocase subunit YajC
MQAWLTVAIFIALFFLMIYLVAIRPMRRREKEHDEMVDVLQRGDVVITAGGIYGTIERIDADSVILKIESGALMKVTKGGVIKKVGDVTPEDYRKIIG